MNGWGRNFVTRRLLEAKSLDEALHIVMNRNCFVGHNYQIMSLTQREAVDVEVAPFGVVGVRRGRYAVWHVDADGETVAFPCEYVQFGDGGRYR